MLKDFLSPTGLRNWLGHHDSAQADHPDSEPRDQARHAEPARTVAELRYDALESLSDAELARLGLSRGVLALRAGCPDRVIEATELTAI